MLHLKSIIFGVSALLFGSVLAAPLPAHIPQIGEIVHVAPAQTHGGTVIGAGGHTAHPHITVGYDHNTGMALLHPITHSNHAGLGPSISTQGMGGLTGNVLLRPVAAHNSNIQSGHGKFANVNVGPHNVHAILHAQQQTQALIAAHNDAAHRHHEAQTDHTNAANAHLAAAQHHANAGHHDWAAAHQAQATWHQGQAATHGQHRASHIEAAGRVRGPDDHALQQAQHSAASTHGSRTTAAASHRYASDSHAHFAAAQSHLGAAHAHHTLAQSYQRMGPNYNHLVQHHFGQAQQHQAAAASHGAHNWAHAPEPHQSAHHATQSANVANHAKARIPAHLRVH